MLIDMHAHVGDMRARPSDPDIPVTWDNLLQRLDEEGIERAALLPVYNASPEGAPPAFALLGGGLSVHDQVLGAAARSDRLIPYGNLDPRWMHNSPENDYGPLLDWLIDQGCRGIGEVTAHIAVDDPRMISMIGQCGERGLPVTIETAGFIAGRYGPQDDPGLPRLEHLLQALPDTTIVAHGPGFWAEIATGVRPEDKWAYPTGPVLEEGAAWRLLRTYDNLHADLSANSGLNGLTRDHAAGVRFLNEFAPKLLFATDICFHDSPLRGQLHQLLQTLRASGELAAEAYEQITHRNAMQLLKLS